MSNDYNYERAHLGWDAGYDVGYQKGLTKGLEQAAKPTWRCAKTDPPKDEREYLAQLGPGMIVSLLAQAIRDSVVTTARGTCIVIRWLDYPDPPPVQSEEEKAFQVMRGSLKNRPCGYDEDDIKVAWEAALAYARSKEKGQP